ncbi:costars family protein [Catenaria anguillulae PL171]|uniref:Costars family protein n=1 Tax=Catenaria anguillulae PL171 TaxID=765915 RepID=A0A1Y2HVU1_9FUNG|nr:costars family protein [Catenaria anguillulae PL171]
MTGTVTQEIEFLVTSIKRLGTPSASTPGQYVVKFGALSKDDLIANTLEGLVGTLKAAKKRKVVKFDAEILLSPVHDNIDVVLLTDVVPPQ